MFKIVNNMGFCGIIKLELADIGVQMWWNNLEHYLNQHIILIGGAMAFITSMIHLWDKPKSFLSKIMDSLLCSSLTYGIYYGISSVYNIPESASIAIGSFVGYLGTEEVKRLILLILKRFINYGDENK